ncbi:MAG: hypothetical protein FJ145_07145 [Deltaproteobacteria bacterium]|nr:hypothetical protein [Deltaproteobacteria bacterium]
MAQAQQLRGNDNTAVSLEAKRLSGKALTALRSSQYQLSERELARRGKKPKATEPVLADIFVCRRIVDIDQHVFIGMAGEETRKYFDELFFFTVVGVQESFADIEAMGPLAAIEPCPKPGTTGTEPI